MQMISLGKEWYFDQPRDVQNLIDRVEDQAELFNDMLFAPGSLTAQFSACQEMIAPDNWQDSCISLPDELQHFSYSYFRFKVENLEHKNCGQYDRKNQIMTISPEYLEDDSAILHEMIHLHEGVINDLPLFYHDTLLFCLYKDLSKKIETLDEIIEKQGHLLNEQALYETGGLHDLLFLLKSFDLDLKKGYQLGTVFGYGLKVH